MDILSSPASVSVSASLSLAALVDGGGDTEAISDGVRSRMHRCCGVVAPSYCVLRWADVSKEEREDSHSGAASSSGSAGRRCCCWRCRPSCWSLEDRSPHRQRDVSIYAKRRPGRNAPIDPRLSTIQALLEYASDTSHHVQALSGKRQDPGRSCHCHTP
jgi:hypothetical protein